MAIGEDDWTPGQWAVDERTEEDEGLDDWTPGQWAVDERTEEEAGQELTEGISERVDRIVEDAEAIGDFLEDVDRGDRFVDADAIKREIMEELKEEKPPTVSQPTESVSPTPEAETPTKTPKASVEEGVIGEGGGNLEVVMRRLGEFSEEWEEEVWPAIQEHGIENIKEFEEWVEEEASPKVKKEWKNKIRPSLQKVGANIEEKMKEVAPIVEDKLAGASKKLRDLFGHTEEHTKESEDESVEEVFKETGIGEPILDTEDESEDEDLPKELQDTIL